MCGPLALLMLTLTADVSKRNNCSGDMEAPSSPAGVMSSTTVTTTRYRYSSNVSNPCSCGGEGKGREGVSY